MTQALAPDLRDAIVRVCGEAFHFYGTLRPVFVAAGVSGELFDAVRANSNSKYVLCRTILAQLDDRGEAGRQAQQHIMRQLASMLEPMADAPDLGKGRQALADLRRLAGSTPAVTERSEAAARRKRSELAAVARQHAADRKEQLRESFAQMTTASGRKELQKRGYDFEQFLGDLFSSEDIAYRGAYRVGTVEQIDGAFTLDSHDYLVEAKWRREPPSLSDLLSLAGKLETKFTDTRGFFISVVAPRPEVIAQLVRSTNKVLIMDGSDLAVILEGRITLRDALDRKLRSANHEGNVFRRLSG